MDIRRRVLARHDRSPVPGSVTLLAPWYKEGVELMYTDMRKVTRYVASDPMPQEVLADLDPSLGSTDAAKDSRGQ